MSQDDQHTRDTLQPLPHLSERDREQLLQLARRTLVQHLEDSTTPSCATNSPALMEPRATFVTLTVRDTGLLRGCRGEVVARLPLIESVAAMAIAAATDDPRFPRVSRDEVPRLRIEISVLSLMDPIDPAEVEVGKHGLMIMRGNAAGLLLPQVAVEYGWDQQEFLDALCRKASLPAGTWRNRDARLYGFECEVWGEDP